MKELTKTALNEHIDKLEVHEAEKIDGKRVQKVTVCYQPKLLLRYMHHFSLFSALTRGFIRSASCETLQYMIR